MNRPFVQTVGNTVGALVVVGAIAHWGLPKGLEAPVTSLNKGLKEAADSGAAKMDEPLTGAALTLGLCAFIVSLAVWAVRNRESKS